jgi:hypothetical protein
MITALDVLNSTLTSTLRFPHIRTRHLRLLVRW